MLRFYLEKREIYLWKLMRNIDILWEFRIWKLVRLRKDLEGYDRG